MSSVRQAYATTLEEAGAVVRWVAADDGVGCVLTSQLARLLAFRDPEVRPKDIVLVSDVNAFVMTHEVLWPVSELEQQGKGSPLHT